MVVRHQTMLLYHTRHGDAVADPAPAATPDDDQAYPELVGYLELGLRDVQAVQTKADLRTAMVVLVGVIALLSLPVAVGLYKKGLKRHEPDNPLDWLALDGSTAQLNLMFGLLATAALGIHALIS